MYNENNHYEEKKKNCGEKRWTYEDLITFLYKQAVEEQGGMELLNNERRWTKVATCMNFPSGKGIGSMLKGHYEKILYPYYLFKRSEEIMQEQRDAVCVQGYKLI